MFHLPEPNDLPPRPAEDEPDSDVDGGDDEAKTPPIVLRDVARSVEDGRSTAAVVRERYHDIGYGGKCKRSKHGRRT